MFQRVHKDNGTMCRCFIYFTILQFIVLISFEADDRIKGSLTFDSRSMHIKHTDIFRF